MSEIKKREPSPKPIIPLKEGIQKQPWVIRLEAISKIVDKKGKRVATKEGLPPLVSLDTTSDYTTGYTAAAYVSTYETHVYRPRRAYKISGTSVRFSLTKNGPPKKPHAVKDLEVYLAISPDGTVYLSVDKEKFPEAVDFEEPARRLGSYKTETEGKIIISAPYEDLGSRTHQFLNQFTQEALQAFQDLR